MQEPDISTDAVIADIVDAVGTVRRILGVGLLESTYKEALTRELVKRGRHVLREHRVAILYDGTPLSGYYSIDLLVDGMACWRQIPQEHQITRARSVDRPAKR